MLKPSTQYLYADLLTPPSGYRLEKGIGLTYSVDLRTLLLSPLAFARLSLDSVAEDVSASDERQEPLQLLEALRRASKKLAIFCQSGRISVPSSYTQLFDFLEPMVHEVKLERGSFHPKLWLLHFTADDKEPRFRCLCTSRNLTFDRSWDMVVTLEGTRVDALQPANEDLRRLLEFLVDQAAQGQREELVREFAEIIPFVEFLATEPFDSVVLRCQGVPHTPPLRATIPEATRSLVVTPFMTADGLDLARRGRSTLIGRKNELDELFRSSPQSFHEADVRVLSNGAVVDGDAEADGDDLDAKYSGDVHAKLYIYETDKGIMWRLGSANATSSGLRGRNVEVLAELSSTSKDTGVDAILARSEDQGDNILFGDILADYHPPGELEVDERKGDLRRSLDRLRAIIARLEMKIMATELGDDLWRLDLLIDGGCALPPWATVKIWPISLHPESDAAQFSDSLPERIAFGQWAMSKLTRFVGVELSIDGHGERVRSSFVRAASAVGFPNDREDRVLHNLISSRARFLAYLRFLLSDDTSRWDGLIRQLETSASWGAGSTTSSRRAPVPLMEILVSQCAKNPVRLREIHTLIQSLRKSPNGAEIVPDDFIEHVFLPVLEALAPAIAREYGDA